MRRFALLAGVLLPLIATEIGLRIWHASQGTYSLRPFPADKEGTNAWMASADPELVYEHRPSLVAKGELQIDSHGILRSTEVAETKPPGLVRIAAIGDSVLASMYLEKPRRMSALLEQNLASSLGRRVEVLNFGCHGYDTIQETRILETKVAPLSPDAVLVVYCLNDPMISVIPWNWFRARGAPWCYTAEFVRESLRKARGLPAETRPWAPFESPTGAAGGPSWRQAYDPEAEGWKLVLNGFDRMAAWSKKHNVPILVAVVPLLLRDDPEGKSTAPFRAQVAAALDARGIPHVSLQETFSAFSVTTLQNADFDIYHLSAEGHEIVADKLAPQIKKLLAK